MSYLASWIRLLFVPAPSVTVRRAAVHEFSHLTRLVRRTEGGGLGDELRAALSHSTDTPADPAAVREAILPTVVASWVHPEARCVARSIRIAQVLNAACLLGSNVDLKIGVRRGIQLHEGRGHMWIEVDGETGIGEDDFVPEEYKVIFDRHQIAEALNRPVASLLRPGLLMATLGPGEAVILDLEAGQTIFTTTEALDVIAAVDQQGDSPEARAVLQRQYPSLSWAEIDRAIADVIAGLRTARLTVTAPA